MTKSSSSDIFSMHDQIIYVQHTFCKVAAQLLRCNIDVNMSMFCTYICMKAGRECYACVMTAPFSVSGPLTDNRALTGFPSFLQFQECFCQESPYR